MTHARRPRNYVRARDARARVAHAGHVRIRAIQIVAAGLLRACDASYVHRASLGSIFAGSCRSPVKVAPARRPVRQL